MPYIKAKKRDLVAGEFYLAYSKQSKMLSSNGTGGVIVQYLGLKDNKPEIKVWRPGGKTRNMCIARLDERKDAFMLPIDAKMFEELKLKMGDQGVFAWPQYTPRMQKAYEDGVELKFESMMKPDERFPEDRIDGTMTFVVETKHDNTTTYLNHYQIRIDEDVLAKVCTAEELENKKREEARKEVEKLKEGGVRLAVGKMDAGQKWLPELEKTRKEFAARCKENASRCCSFEILYGKDMGGEVKDSYQYDDAPCHAQLCRKSGDLTRLVVLTSSTKAKYQNNHVTEEMMKEWIDFLINRSIYADIFIDKDVERVFQLGYVVNCFAPSNVVQQAMVMTRQLWEKPYRVLAWDLLRRHIPENLAMVVCMRATGTVNEKGVLTDLKWNNTDTGHTPIDVAALSNKSLMFYLYNGVSAGKMNESLSVTKVGYSSPHRVFDVNMFDKEDNNDLVGKLRAMPVQKADKANPFEMAKSPVDKAVDFAAETINNWLEDKAYA